MKPRFSPMQSADSPKPVAAMLATTALSVDALRALQRSLTRPVCGIGLLPEVAKNGLLQLIQKLVVVRRKKVLTGGGAGRVCCSGAGDRGRRREANPDSRRAEQIPRPAICRSNSRRERLMGPNFLFSLNPLHKFKRSCPGNDDGGQTRVTGMVTPPEPKDLDERGGETKNLVCERAS